MLKNFNFKLFRNILNQTYLIIFLAREILFYYYPQVWKLTFRFKKNANKPYLNDLILKTNLTIYRYKKYFSFTFFVILWTFLIKFFKNRTNDGDSYCTLQWLLSFFTDPVKMFITWVNELVEKLKNSPLVASFLWLSYQTFYARPVYFFNNRFVDLCLDIFYYFYPQEKYTEVPDIEEVELRENVELAEEKNILISQLVSSLKTGSCPAWVAKSAFRLIPVKALSKRQQKALVKAIRVNALFNSRMLSEQKRPNFLFRKPHELNRRVTLLYQLFSVWWPTTFETYWKSFNFPKTHVCYYPPLFNDPSFIWKSSLKTSHLGDVAFFTIKFFLFFLARIFSFILFSLIPILSFWKIFVFFEKYYQKYFVTWKKFSLSLFPVFVGPVHGLNFFAFFSESLFHPLRRWLEWHFFFSSAEPDSDFDNWSVESAVDFDAPKNKLDLEDDVRIDFISLTDEAALDDGWSEVESEEEEEDDLEESLDRDPAALDSSDEDEDKPRDSSLSAEERDDNWLQWGDWVTYGKKFPEDTFVSALTWLMAALFGGILYVTDNRDLLQEFSDFFVFYYMKILSDIDSWTLVGSLEWYWPEGWDFYGVSNTWGGLDLVSWQTWSLNTDMELRLYDVVYFKDVYINTTPVEPFSLAIKNGNLFYRNLSALEFTPTALECLLGPDFSPYWEEFHPSLEFKTLKECSGVFDPVRDVRRFSYRETFTWLSNFLPGDYYSKQKANRSVLVPPVIFEIWSAMHDKSLHPANFVEFPTFPELKKNEEGLPFEVLLTHHYIRETLIERQWPADRELSRWIFYTPPYVLWRRYFGPDAILGFDFFTAYRNFLSLPAGSYNLWKDTPHVLSFGLDRYFFPTLCFWPLEPAITSKNIYLGEDSPVLEELIASDVYPEELWYQNPRKGSWPWPMAEEDTSLSAWWWPLNASVTSVNWFPIIDQELAELDNPVIFNTKESRVDSFNHTINRVNSLPFFSQNFTWRFVDNDTFLHLGPTWREVEMWHVQDWKQEDQFWNYSVLWENKAFVALSENKYPRLPDFWFSEMPNEVYTAMPEDHKSFINSYHITNKKTETKLSLSDRFWGLKTVKPQPIWLWQSFSTIPPALRFDSFDAPVLWPWLIEDTAHSSGWKLDKVWNRTWDVTLHWYWGGVAKKNNLLEQFYSFDPLLKLPRLFSNYGAGGESVVYLPDDNPVSKRTFTYSHQWENPEIKSALTWKREDMNWFKLAVAFYELMGGFQAARDFRKEFPNLRELEFDFFITQGWGLPNFSKPQTYIEIWTSSRVGIAQFGGFGMFLDYDVMPTSGLLWDAEESYWTFKLFQLGEETPDWRELEIEPSGDYNLVFQFYRNFNILENVWPEIFLKTTPNWKVMGGFNENFWLNTTPSLDTPVKFHLDIFSRWSDFCSDYFWNAYLRDDDDDDEDSTNGAFEEVVAADGLEEEEDEELGWFDLPQTVKNVAISKKDQALAVYVDSLKLAPAPAKDDGQSTYRLEVKPTYDTSRAERAEYIKLVKSHGLTDTMDNFSKPFYKPAPYRAYDFFLNSHPTRLNLIDWDADLMEMQSCEVQRTVDAVAWYTGLLENVAESMADEDEEDLQEGSEVFRNHVYPASWPRDRMWWAKNFSQRDNAAFFFGPNYWANLWDLSNWNQILFFDRSVGSTYIRPQAELNPSYNGWSFEVEAVDSDACWTNMGCASKAPARKILHWDEQLFLEFWDKEPLPNRTSPYSYPESKKFGFDDTYLGGTGEVFEWSGQLREHWWDYLRWGAWFWLPLDLFLDEEGRAHATPELWSYRSSSFSQDSMSSLPVFRTIFPKPLVNYWRDSGWVNMREVISGLRNERTPVSLFTAPCYDDPTDNYNHLEAMRVFRVQENYNLWNWNPWKQDSLSGIFMEPFRLDADFERHNHYPWPYFGKLLKWKLLQEDVTRSWPIGAKLTLWLEERDYQFNLGQAHQRFSPSLLGQFFDFKKVAPPGPFDFEKMESYIFY